MLFAVEGGGFFSASASGYSKGLTFLLLGQKGEEEPMRISPWNQYQLVDQDSNPDLQLASRKNRLVRACTSFVCFGSTAAGLEAPSPLKVGPKQPHGGPPDSNKGKDHSHTTDIVNNDSSIRKLALKGCLKKPTNTDRVSGEVDNEHEALCGKGSDTSGHMERRKVQWMDTSGGELAEIQEFEPSDVSGSEDEFDNGNERTCSCKIM